MCLLSGMYYLKETTELTFLLIVLLMPISALAYLIGVAGKCPLNERIHLAKRACIIAGGIGIFFALTGPSLFSSLGIGIPAFKIFAGILLFVNGLSLLKLKGNQHVADYEKKRIQKISTDMAITPLAFPLLTGPATIGQLITHYEKAKSSIEHLMLSIAVVIALTLSYLLFYVCLKHLNILSSWTLGLAERFTGLFAVTLAVQCVINGIQGVFFV